jgi:hypothetical protein
MAASNITIVIACSFPALNPIDVPLFVLLVSCCSFAAFLQAVEGLD